MEAKFGIILLMGVLATQSSRLLPAFFLSKRDLSPKFENWLSHLPIAILSALLVPEFISVHPSHQHFQMNWLFLAGSAVCFSVGLKTKNLLLTTFTGVLFVAVMRCFKLG